MDVLPEAGRHLTVADLARHVDDLAGRLYAAEVRYGERIAIYKAANFDAWLLAAAAERIGAVPVMLSPALDGATVAALLRRLDQPHLNGEPDGDGPRQSSDHRGRAPTSSQPMPPNRG